MLPVIYVPSSTSFFLPPSLYPLLPCSPLCSLLSILSTFRSTMVVVESGVSADDFREVEAAVEKHNERTGAEARVVKCSSVTDEMSSVCLAVNEYASQSDYAHDDDEGQSQELHVLFLKGDTVLLNSTGPPSISSLISTHVSSSSADCTVMLKRSAQDEGEKDKNKSLPKIREDEREIITTVIATGQIEVTGKVPRTEVDDEYADLAETPKYKMSKSSLRMSGSSSGGRRVTVNTNLEDLEITVFRFSPSSRSYTGDVRDYASSLINSSHSSCLAYILPPDRSASVYRISTWGHYLHASREGVHERSKLEKSSSPSGPLTKKSSPSNPESTSSSYRILHKDSSAIHETCDLSEKVTVKTSTIHSNCAIGHGTKINNTILHPNSIISSNCVIQNCVIGRNVEIGEGGKFNDCRVQDGAKIGKGGRGRGEDIRN